jgi:hypothetical protein
VKMSQTMTYGSEQSRLFLPSQEALATLRLQREGKSKDTEDSSQAETLVNGWTPVIPPIPLWMSTNKNRLPTHTSYPHGISTRGFLPGQNTTMKNVENTPINRFPIFSAKLAKSRTFKSKSVLKLRVFNSLN